ncbi:MAG TPA: hypothetical protein VGM08_03480 [Candidatus Saccharimonadales bacterium]|jgi:hypothetical protein
MDKSKPRGAAAGVGSGGEAGMPAVKARRGGPMRAKFKLAGLVVGTVVVLAALGFGGYALLHHKKAQPSTYADAGSKSSQPVGLSDYSADQKAQYYMSQQNYAAASDIYKSELAAVATTADKAQLNLQLATIAIDSKDYSQADQYASQAETLVQSYQTAKLVAYAAQLNGDKQNAAKYYQLAISRLDKSTPGYNYILSELQASLQEVSS